MNEALERLARTIRLEDPANKRVRLEFGYACALRVQHLLEEPAVAGCLAALERFLRDDPDPEFQWQVSCLASLVKR
jgi:hypothetical protein